MNTIQTKERKKNTKDLCPLSLKHNLFICWSCSCKELLIAAFLNRTFFFYHFYFYLGKNETRMIMQISIYLAHMESTIAINWDIGMSWQKSTVDKSKFVLI